MTTSKLLSFNIIVLGLFGIIDLIRGLMHTFFNTFAGTNIAQIVGQPDAFFLLGAFGISNFVTGFIFLVIYKKAPELAPYILLTVALGYALGVIGLQIDGVTMQSAFLGQYFMFVYLGISLILPTWYFIRYRADASSSSAA